MKNSAIFYAVKIIKHILSNFSQVIPLHIQRYLYIQSLITIDVNKKWKHKRYIYNNSFNEIF